MIKEVMGILGSSMLAVAPAPQVELDTAMQRGQNNSAYLREEEGLPLEERAVDSAIVVKPGIVLAEAVRKRRDTQRKVRYLGDSKHRGWIKIL